VSRVRVGRVLRTVRHLRPSQAVAQARHLLLSDSLAAIEAKGDAAPTTAAAAVPFPPPARHAGVLVSEREIAVRLLEREVVFRGAIDWDHELEGPLFSYHLHQFDWARDRGAPPESRLVWMLDWVEHHREGIGWDPHPISHRVFAWGKLLLSGGLAGEESDQAVLRRSLASQIETLSRNLEIRLQANHLLTNLLAVVFGGLLLDGPLSKAWLRRSQDLRAELRQQLGADGAHEERSPMYHALLLEQVLDLLNLARAVPQRASGLTDDLEAAAARMRGALEVWTHPDGEIALFSDSAFGIAQAPHVLDDYASALGVAAERPARPDHLAQAGFVRLADEPFDLIASVAGPGPDHQPGHAHCDALAFELSLEGRRVVTDTGVYEYAPGALRDVARATRSHATLEVDGRDQAEVWAAHRVGGRPRVRVLDYEPGRAVEASCQSWSTPEVVHRRRFELRGGVLEIHDAVDAPRGARLRFTLPLAPGLRARLVGPRRGPSTLRVDLEPEGALEVDLPGPGLVDWRLEASDYFPTFGRREQRWCLIGDGGEGGDGDSDRFERGTWRFRRVSR
jgi:hypothetical protein